MILSRHPLTRSAARGLLTLCFASFVAVSPSAAQLAVSPARFELPVGDKPTTETIRLFNSGREAVEIEVSIVHWDLDEANEVRTLSPNEQSLDQWLVVNPLRLTVPANGAQTVRFSVRPRVRPEAGEHRGMIFFNQLENEDKKGVQFLFRVGVAIYGHVGEVNREGTLHGLVPDGQRVALDVSSEGSANVRFRGQYSFWRVDAFPGEAETAQIAELDQPETVLPAGVALARNLPSTPVLPGTRRRIPLEIPGDLEDGVYVLDLNAQLGDQVIDRAVRFRWSNGVVAMLPPSGDP